jgi:hypothetical protein
VVSKFVIFVIGQARNFILWLQIKGFIVFVSLTGLPTMKPLTLMYMLVTSHSLMSMQKMVRGFLFLLFFFFFNRPPLNSSDLKLLLISAAHLTPLLEHIAKLDEAINNIYFEQHWLQAQTDRQAIGTT